VNPCPASHKKYVKGSSMQLGSDELHLHGAMESLQQSIRAVLGAQQQVQSSRQDAAVQTSMAQLRAQIRDLELLAEEQDA